jgi:hypothetical protein
LRNEPITPEQLRAKILHKTDEKKYSLIEVYKYHNEQFGKLVGLEFVNGTFKKFKSATDGRIRFIGK